MDKSQEQDVKHSQNVVPFPQKKEDPGEGFKGQFTNMKLSDLIQLATQGRMSLILHITHNGKEGKIYIYEGEIIHAVYNKKTGIDAFFEIMSWKKGDFSSEEYIPPPIQSITLPWEHLLIEAHRWMDEKKVETHDSPKTKVLPLDSLSKDVIELIKSWAESHSDIAEIGVFSPVGIRSIFQRNSKSKEEITLEILHTIPDTALYLSNALSTGTCEEVTLTASDGTLIFLCLKDDLQLFVHITTDITQKAILKLELRTFVSNIKKKLKP